MYLRAESDAPDVLLEIIKSQFGKNVTVQLFTKGTFVAITIQDNRPRKQMDLGEKIPLFEITDRASNHKYTVFTNGLAKGFGDDFYVDNHHSRFAHSVDASRPIHRRMII
jgi:hypothetical protein